MADDEWQLKAVHEQFDVFETLFEPCSSFAVTELREIINKVNVVIRKQMRVKSGKAQSPTRHISAELIKAIPDSENNLHLSYVVVVTNEDIDGNLCKIPVFRVLVEEQHTFVDIRGSVYRSWDAFMKNNDLPSCKFCYPVNGCYDVGGKLKIEFALSPAASWSKVKVWWIIGEVVVGTVIVGASFYFGIAPIVSKYTQTFINIAGEFLPKIVTEIMRLIIRIGNLYQNFQKGDTDVLELSKIVFNDLRTFYSNFQEEIDLMWEKTKKTLSAVYSYLSRIFNNYFKKASRRSQNDFLTQVTRVEKEISQSEDEADAQLNQMRKERKTESYLFGSSLKSVFVAATAWPLNYLIPSVAVPTASTMSTAMVLSYNQQIFQNCLSTSALQYEIKNRTYEQDNCTQSQPFTSTTEKLLSLTETVANQLGVETLSDVKDILESLSVVVKDEYRNKIDTYIKGVHAAEAVAGRQIDLDVYNRALNIIGDPKDHYMKEALQSVQEPRLAFRLKEKIKEFRADNKIFLIPIYKKSEDDDTGLYKAIGVRGNGKFSAQWLIGVLKESFVDLKESTLVVNETNTLIHIRSEEVSIFAYQEVNEENTSEGIIYVVKS